MSRKAFVVAWTEYLKAVRTKAFIIGVLLTPVLFGGGRRLFENLREPAPRFRIDKVLDTPTATHLRYVRD